MLRSLSWPKLGKRRLPQVRKGRGGGGAYQSASGMRSVDLTCFQFHYFVSGTQCKLGVRLSREGDVYTTEDASDMQIKYNRLKECREYRRG